MIVLAAIHYVRKCGELARELRDMDAAWRNAVAALHAAEAHVADLEMHLENMSMDNADLERQVAAMAAGVRWFEGTK